MSNFQQHPEYSRYLISTTGVVYDKIKRKTLISSLTGGREGHRYYRVFIQVSPGKKKHKYVHHLVAETYLPNSYFEGAVIDHINSITTQNHVANLQWVTQSENIIKRRRTYDHTFLTLQQVREIKLMAQNGWNPSRISRALGTKYQATRKVVIGKTYSEVDITFASFPLTEPKLF